MDACAARPPTPYPAVRPVSRAPGPSLGERAGDGEGRGREAVHADRACIAGYTDHPPGADHGDG